MSTLASLKDSQQAPQIHSRTSVVNPLQKSASRTLLLSIDKLNKAKSKLSLMDLKRLEGSDSNHSSKNNIRELKSSKSVDLKQLDPSNEIEARVEQLPLPFEMLKGGLSELGPAPEGNRLVYRKLSLPFSGLSNISSLKDYPFIQHLELQGNNLTNVSALSHLKYLVSLDLSNNKLTEVLNFAPPYNLQIVDLSRNQITSIGDLSAHQFLKSLALDRNLLKSLHGLSKSRRLKHLTVTNNGITRIDALKDLPLEILDIRSNRLETLSGVEYLPELKELKAAHNGIRTTAPLQNHPKLRLLDLESNQIASIADIETLKTLPSLRNLRIRKTPLIHSQSWQPESANVIPVPNTLHPPSCRLKIIFLLQSLNILDSMPISPEEKVAAANMYNPHPHVIASLQHAYQQTKIARTYAKIKAEDLIRAKRLRPIVLCGPNGTGKRTLTSRLLTEFPQIYGLSVSHTTRKPRDGEENGVHYHFVSKSEMERMNEEGKFVQMVTLFGNMYGTSMDAIDKVTEEGKVCIMDLEIEGVVALRKTHLKPRYIFITTPDMNVLKERLQGRLNQSNQISKSHTTKPISENQSEEATISQDPVGSTAVDSLSSSLTTSAGANDEANVDTMLNHHEDKSTNVSVWMKKAQLETQEYQKISFDLTVVNDNLDRAYAQLKEYCLSVYWKDFEEED